MKTLAHLVGLTSPIWFIWFWAFLGDSAPWPESRGYKTALVITLFIAWVCTIPVAATCSVWVKEWFE